MTESYSELVSLAQNAGFSASDAGIAAAVALAESSGNPNATHTNTDGSTDLGLWQINNHAWPELAAGSWSDPQTNADDAFYVYQRQGWDAWTTYKTGAYVKYMTNSGTVEASDDVQDASLGSVVSGSGQVLAQLGKLLAFVIQPKNWERVALGGVGVVLVIVGAVALAKPVTEPVAKAATKAAGAAVKVVK